MNYSLAMSFLASAPVFTDKEAQKKDMSRVLEALGNPHLRVKAIHVAGTNGKGSTCAYLNSILQAGGYRVGLFTSPYLVSFSERIQINGIQISQRDIAKCMTAISCEAEKISARITQFGYITIMMFMYFASRSVDYAVIEVGLGGGDDPTNLCSPCICAITSISLDHTKLLGSTYYEIAVQKAGIIKRGIPVITVSQRPDAAEAIAERAGAMQAELYTAAPELISSGENGTEFMFEKKRYKTSLLGAYQSDNAAAAIKTATVLGIDCPDIYTAVASTEWAGRMQVICREPYMLVDGAHNPDAADKLAEFVCALDGDKILITGMAADKDIVSCVKAFAKFTDYVYTVNINSPRSISSGELLARYNENGVQGTACRDVLQAVSMAVSKHRCGGRIIICGSLFLAGEVLKLRSEGAF